jgi:hypothetical protein
MDIHDMAEYTVMLKREYHKQFFQELKLKAGEKVFAIGRTHRLLREKAPGTFTF